MLPRLRRGACESVCRSKIQVVGHAFDELDGMTTVFIGGEHLGRERELGVDHHPLRAVKCTMNEIHCERMVSSGLAAFQDSSVGIGIWSRRR